MWWSDDRSFYETIPTIHWCPDDRLLEEGTQFSCLVFSLSTCLPVKRAGCTLLGGLVSREKLTVLGMGLVIVRKSSHDHGYTGRLLDVSHPDLNEIALSTMWMLDTWAFFRLVILRLVLYVLAASDRSWGCLENSFPSQLSEDITWFQYAQLSWRREANKYSSPEEKPTRVLKSK